MSEINNKSASPLLPQQGGEQTDPAQEGFLAWIASADNPIRGMHDGEHPLPVTYRAGYAAGLAAVSQQAELMSQIEACIEIYVSSYNYSGDISAKSVAFNLRNNVLPALKKVATESAVLSPENAQTAYDDVRTLVEGMFRNHVGVGSQGADIIYGWNGALGQLLDYLRSRTPAAVLPQVGEAIAWWNGIRKGDPYTGIYPSFSETEDTNHDIPMYSGINPCNLAAPAGLGEAKPNNELTQVADRYLCAAYQAGSEGIEFDLLVAKREIEAAAPVKTVASEAKLSVWYGSMPESNGKSNFTAILHKGDICEGITLDRSEYPERVRYEADRMRYLIGEIDVEPFILDYDGEKHSGYATPVAQALPGVSDVTIIDALKDALSEWKYIRESHGDLYGVGCDRVEKKLTTAIAAMQGENP